MIKNAEEIKNSVSVYDVVKNVVDLTKRGASYTGLCPFHNEKSPSFHVFQSTNTYHCYGCGAHGNNAVDFLIESQNLTFPEALEAVASIGKVSVQYEQKYNKPEVLKAYKEKKDRMETLSFINHLAWRTYFHAWYLPSMLANNKIPFAGRTYRIDTIRKWGLFKVDDDNLIQDPNYLQELLELGILRNGQYGLYNSFRRRWVFPIHDHKGRVVGFGARKDENDKTDSPKYFNSNESDLYHKGDLLFGLDKAKKSIHVAGFATLVEGYTDVITMDEFGISNVVAPCGTSLNDKQAKLLKQYTDEVVVMRDSDDAGFKATTRDVEILIQAGLKVKVCFIPTVVVGSKHDPDSYLRKFGLENFNSMFEENTKDGLIWRVMLEHEDGNLFKQESTIQTAGRLLAYLDSSTLVEGYIKELTKKNLLGPLTKLIRESVSKIKKDMLTKNTEKYTIQQEKDIMAYGIYEMNNQYFMCNHLEDSSYSISNFVIKPIMLIQGASKALRLMEILDKNGNRNIMEIDSDDFVQLSKFQNHLGRMNLLFSGEPKSFVRIQSKVMAETYMAYPITTLGLHKKGFWSWANGISVDGSFLPIDDNGLVQYDNVSYYLPTYSKVRMDHKSDEMKDSFQDLKAFTYHNIPAISFQEWTIRMVKVYGDKAMIAVAWYCASLFRDIIMTYNSGFPHLNLFGPPKCGKSEMAKSISYMFGVPKAFQLHEGTDVAFFRKVAQIRNGVAYLEEYSNDISIRRIQALKSFYDGDGRIVGENTSENRTVTTPVLSSSIIAGQYQCTKDIALFSRVISLNFNVNKYDFYASHRIDELKKIQESGQLLSITAMLQKYRDDVTNNFYEKWNKYRNELKTTLIDEVSVDERPLKNYSVMIAIVELLMEKGIEFGFGVDDIKKQCIEHLVEQCKAMSNEDDTSTWWTIIQYLISTQRLLDNDDIIVQPKSKEKLLKKFSDKTPVEHDFGKDKVLLYINLNKAHPMYMEQYSRMYNKQGMNSETLKFYLSSSPGFLGVKKSKRFGEVIKACFVFDVAAIGLELKLTKDSREFPFSNDDDN